MTGPSTAGAALASLVEDAENSGAGKFLPYTDDAGAGDGGSSSSGEQRELCVNCLHPVDMHAEGARGIGLECQVKIAVAYNDRPYECLCWRCIPPGTPCAFDGCDRAAERHIACSGILEMVDLCGMHHEETAERGQRWLEPRLRARHGAPGCGNAAGRGARRRRPVLAQIVTSAGGAGSGAAAN